MNRSLLSRPTGPITKLNTTVPPARFVWLVLLTIVLPGAALAGPSKPSPQSPSRAVATPIVTASTGTPTITPLTPNQPSTQTLPAAQPSSVVADTWSERLGGAVFSTGSGDVVARIRSLTDPQVRTIAPDRKLLPSPWSQAIYLVSPGPKRLIGSSKEGGKVVHLGPLPPGELIFSVETPDGYTLSTGDSGRNPDHLYHAITRTYKSGLIEIWFEDAPGPLHAPGSRSDRNFTDAVLQLRGGVSNSSAVADLLKIIKEQHGEAQVAAIAALRQIDPKAAAAAGFPIAGLR